SHSVSGATQPSPERVSAVDLALFHRAAGLAADRRASRAAGRETDGRTAAQRNGLQVVICWYPTGQDEEPGVDMRRDRTMAKDFKTKNTEHPASPGVEPGVAAMPKSQQASPGVDSKANGAAPRTPPASAGAQAQPARPFRLHFGKLVPLL